MPFLTGLHGAVATLLLCALLFIDEAGVPLPFAPNEVLLMFAGLLIASDGLNVFLFYPLACAAMVAGTYTGYSWARALGPTQLRAVAQKLRATRAYDRATGRMRTADARAVAITRLLPGVRVYATLVAGASQLPLRTFMRGAVPAIFAWCAVFSFLGWAVGKPAQRALSEFEAFAISGGLLLVLGGLGYRAARRAPRAGVDEGPGHFAVVPRWLRLALAIALDVGLVATLTSGLDRVARSLFQLKDSTAGKPDSGLLVAAIALSYILASRRGRGGVTVGERLFDASYVRHRTPEAIPAGPTRPESDQST